MKNKFTKIGFTLIEILVSVSIIGLLASLTLVSFGGTQKSARDIQRKSDLKQYAAALENYATQHSSLYPSRTSTSGASLATTVCTDLALTSCPEDPKNSSDSSYFYRYQSDGSDGGASNGTKFVLWAKIEKSTDYWIVCSDGKVGVKTQSGFSVSGGVCPI